MILDVLVSTMYDEINLYKKMNIQGSAVIVNQADYEDKEIKKISNDKILKFISTTDRGLSKSRNLAIKNSNADICLFSDNDVVYEDDYIKTVLDAYKYYHDADIIAFTVESTDATRPINVLKNGRVNRVMSMKLSSVQITFKRNIIEEYKLELNENFGAGSSVFNNGEENIFLYQAIKKGLKVYYVDKKISTVSFEESTWYGKDPEKDLLTKGAMFYFMSPLLYPVYNLQFALRKYKEYKDKFTFFKAIKIMFQGSKQGKNILKSEKQAN